MAARKFLRTLAWTADGLITTPAPTNDFILLTDLPAGTLTDMLANFTNAANALSNPSAAALSVGTWNVITATAACNAKLPAPAAGAVCGVRVVPTSTNLFTLNPHVSETIDGASSRIMWAAESAVLVSDGTNWFKVAGKAIPMVCEMSLGTGLSLTNSTFTNGGVNTIQTDNTRLMASTVNTRIVVQRPGLYSVSACGSFAGNGTGTAAFSAAVPLVLANAQKNAQDGVTNRIAQGGGNGVATGQAIVASQDAFVSLVAGDYVSFGCYAVFTSGAVSLVSGGFTTLSLLEASPW